MKRPVRFLIILAIALSTPFLISASGTEQALLLPLLLIILLIFSAMILVALFIAAFTFGQARGKRERSKQWESYVNQVAASEFERGKRNGMILGAEEALKDFTILQKPLIKEIGAFWWKEIEITCKTELFYKGFPIKLEWKSEEVYKAKIDDFPLVEAQLDSAISLPWNLGKCGIKVEVKPNFETKNLAQSQRDILVNLVNGKYSNERKISNEISQNGLTTVDVTPSLTGYNPRFMLPPSK